MEENMFSWPIVSIVIGCLFLIVLIGASYVKAPPSVAYLISGLSKNPRVLIGKGGIRIPFFERIDKVYLGQMSVDIKTSVPVPTKDFINVRVDAVAKIRVKPDAEGIRLAGKNFLNMSEDEIQRSLQDSLEGNMREIIGTLDLISINTDRDTFSDQIALKAGADMSKLGIEILSCNIQNVTDEQGLIKDLGADNTYKIKKEAAITKAQAERDIEIEQAKAQKEANDVRVLSETAIAERNNELAIKQAELKQISDTKKAEAEAAYKIMENEQMKTVNEKEVDAQIAKTKREQILSEERIKIRENELAAELEKQADAEKYQTETNASASKSRMEREAEAELVTRTRRAEAQRIEAEQQALALRAEAEAKRAAQILEAEAKKEAMLLEAEGIKAIGEANALRIKMEGEAEAKALDAKAKAYKSYNDTIKLQEALIEILPQVAAEVAKPISALKDVKLFGGQMSQVNAEVPAVTKMVYDTMTEATGVDMRDVLKSKTIQAQTDRNVKTDGSDVVAIK